MSTFVRFRDANLTNEEGAGKILAKLVGQAVVVGAETSCRVEEKGGGADDTVDVQVGELIILDDDGFALGAWSDAIVNLPVTSNSSGDPRIDVVVAYVDKSVEDNGANNSPTGLVFDIVDGTPAGSPTPPNDATIQAAVGADNPFIKLAQIAVADSFVSITDAEITDIRKQLSIQSGGKKLQYNVANNIWTLEDSLEVETEIQVDTINEKTPAAGVTIDGVLLKDGLAWQTWAPSWTNFTVGNGTLNYAKFVQIGKTVHFRLKFTLGSTSSMGSAPQFSLPVAPHAGYGDNDSITSVAKLVDTGTAQFVGMVQIDQTNDRGSLIVYNSATAKLAVSTITSAVPMTWADTDVMIIAGTYEAA